ncbi:MAG: methylmalonyl-CoA mutase [Gammaproteobacteria bacterium]|nr:methylmalonyl-CoA mutase [Gammaproteobacteria bacterium]
MNSIRILIGILGMDQHEVAAVGIAKMLRDNGMEVIYAGCFNTPETILQSAIEEDVDVIGISSHSWEYLYYMPELMELLQKEANPIPVVVGGSVITAKDKTALGEIGVASVFGSGTNDEEIIGSIQELAEAFVAASC